MGEHQPLKPWKEIPFGICPTKKLSVCCFSSSSHDCIQRWESAGAAGNRRLELLSFVFEESPLVAGAGYQPQPGWCITSHGASPWISQQSNAIDHCCWCCWSFSRCNHWESCLGTWSQPVSRFVDVSQPLRKSWLNHSAFWTVRCRKGDTKGSGQEWSVRHRWSEMAGAGIRQWG